MCMPVSAGQSLFEGLLVAALGITRTALSLLRRVKQMFERQRLIVSPPQASFRIESPWRTKALIVRTMTMAAVAMGSANSNTHNLAVG